MTEEATILSRQCADLLRAGGCSERTIDNYLYALKGLHTLPRRALAAPPTRTSDLHIRHRDVRCDVAMMDGERLQCNWMPMARGRASDRPRRRSDHGTPQAPRAAPPRFKTSMEIIVVRTSL